MYSLKPRLVSLAALASVTVHAIGAGSGEWAPWAPQPTTLPPAVPHRIARARAAEPSPVEVDILVLYTTAARDGAGGVDALKSAILDGFEVANQIHANSRTAIRLNPVAVLQSPLTETGSSFTDVPNLAGGVGSTLRSDYRADLVLLVFENDKSEIYAVAGPGRAGTTGNSAAAYFGLQRTYPTGLGAGIANRSAFLMGCGGDPADRGSFSHSLAHRFQADGIEFGTIMGSLGMNIPYFSNPEVLYRGQPTGVEGAADNAATLRELGPRVADYQRCTNRIQFELAATTVSEAEGMVRLRIVRTGPSETASQFQVSPVNGTARSGTDFDFAAQVIRIEPGETERIVEVPLRNDTEAQGTRAFQLRLRSPSAGTGVGMNGLVDIRLEDDDLPFGITTTEGVVPEGGNGTPVRITRTRGVETEASVTLDFVPGGTQGSLLAASSPGGAPAPLPLTVRFNPGQAEASVLLSVTEDAQAVPDVAVRIGLQGPWPEGTPGTDLTLWLRDNDGRFGVVGSTPTQRTAGAIEGPVLALPDGSFLAGRRAIRGGAVRLERFRTDGTTDPQWPVLQFKESAEADAGLQFGRLNQMIRQPDGKILVAGYFAAVNDTPRSGLVRLLPGGAIDPEFQTGLGFSGPVRGVCVQPDGGIVAVGAFGEFNGVMRSVAARLMPNGSLDDSFQPRFTGIFTGFELTAVAMQGDRILVSGQFTHVDSHDSPGVARLHPDGTADTTFRSTFDGVALGFRVLPGGDLYAFGPFLSPARWAVSLQANGRFDSRRRFRGLTGPVQDILPVAGGESYLCGRFPGLSPTPPLFGRFASDGTPLAGFGPRFDPAGSVTAVLAGPSGELTLVGRMTEAGGVEAASMIRLGAGAWSTELRQPRQDAGGLSMEAQTIPGLLHRLERSSDWDSWEVVETRDATAHATWFHDPEPVPASFYRLSVGTDDATAPGSRP